jgi:hypothetical protein
MAMPTSRVKWSAYTILVLFGLLFIQSIWFVGTTTLKDYEKLQKEMQQIQDEKAKINAAAAGGSSATASSLIAPLSKREEFLLPQMGSAVGSIKIWNRMWRWMIFWRPVGSELEDSSTEQNAELRSASGATQVLGLYILPLFYGWLGSLLWVVRKLTEDVSDPAFDKLNPGARVVTGMVAGPVIGMFLSPEFLNSLAFQATPFLIAFIGGYSTDVFFSVIDRILVTFRNALDKPVDQEKTDSKKPAESQA